jgi:spore maturation protein CgeB
MIATVRRAPGRAVVVCDQWLGSNGFAGLKALRRAGWSVQVVAEWEYVPVKWASPALRATGRLLRHAAVREFNAAVTSEVERSAAELLLVFKGAFVTGGTIARVRAAGARAYCFYPDLSTRTHGPYIPRALREYDWVFTTKRFGIADMAQHLHVTRASVLPHGYDPDLHRPLELHDYDRGRYGCDVSFIGTWSPKKERILASLRERLPALNVRVWGGQWRRARHPLVRAAASTHPIEGDEYVRAICASTINLAILSEKRVGASSDDQITSRTFHIPACGGFMLHERTGELAEYLVENESVGCFGDVEELVAQVTRFLGDSVTRETIARRGRAAVVPRHAWDARIRDILDHHAQAAS